MPLKKFADVTDAELDELGGKGRNLVLLTRGAFPVPDGFVVPAPETSAQRIFNEPNQVYYRQEYVPQEKRHRVRVRVFNHPPEEHEDDENR